MDVESNSKPFKLAGSENTLSRTAVEVRGVLFGGAGLAIVGGPCGVESKKQVFAVARYITESGVKLFRAGAFKPCSHSRSSTMS